MTPKTSCTLIPNREFFIVVRRDSMMAKVYFLLSGFRFLLCLFLCFYGCRGLVVACLPERSQVLLNGTPPLCSVNEHKGGGYARFAHWRAISFWYRLGGVCVVVVRNIAIGIVLSRSFRVRDCSRHICNRFE